MSDFLHSYEITAETIPSAFDAIYSKKRDAVIVEVEGEKISILYFDKVSHKLKYMNPIYEQKEIEELASRFKTYILGQSKAKA
jgi:hypothetical protein